MTLVKLLGSIAASVVLVVVAVFVGYGVSELVAQETPPEQGIPGPPVEVVMPDIPELTLADVVSILDDYNLRHEDSQLFGRSFYGVTDSKSRTIYISTTVDMADRRETIIHELLHAKYRQLGNWDHADALLDTAIDNKAQEIYRAIYGRPSPPKSGDINAHP